MIKNNSKVTTDKKIIAQRLTAARLDRSLTQSELAQLISEITHRETPIAIPTISSWEQGRRSPSEEMIYALAQIYGIRREYLQGLSDDKYGFGKEDGDDKASDHVVTQKMLSDYDKKPLYVEFKNIKHEDQWGIYDHNSRSILCLAGRLHADDPSISRLLAMEEHYFTANLSNGKKPMSYLKLMNYTSKIFVEMKTTDPYIRGKYNGWFKHNEDHTALINSIGLVLPYEGLNVSYEAYAPGRATDTVPYYKKRQTDEVEETED